MIEWYEILIRLLLASLLGALIGLERERKDWAAGMRTHMMVCVGACLIMIVSAFGFHDILGTDNVRLDPSRVAAQVVSGIGFIGAGAILFLKQGATVRGLTTAAGLWTVAAIGLAAGGGMYFAAVSTTIIALLILWALQPLEHIYSKKFKQISLKIITDINNNDKDILNHLIDKNNLKIQSYSIEKRNDNYIFSVKLKNIDESKIGDIIEDLKNNHDIKEFTFVQ